MSDLLKINVNDHTEKKNGLTYLSWAWAWAEVLKVDPKAVWCLARWGDQPSPAFFLPDGSAMVAVTVTIKGDSKNAILPVMNHRNQAIKNPDAFAINTAIQRCLAKAIAIHGLGLYIYAGEDLPEGDEPEKPARAVHKPTDQPLDLTDDRKAELDELALVLIEAHAEGRSLHASEMFYSLPSQDEQLYIWQQLATESKVRSAIKANKKENA